MTKDEVLSSGCIFGLGSVYLVFFNNATTAFGQCSSLQCRIIFHSDQALEKTAISKMNFARTWGRTWRYIFRPKKLPIETMDVIS